MPSRCWSHFILKSKSPGCRVRGNVSAGWEGVATELCKYLQLVMVFIMRLIAEDIGPHHIHQPAQTLPHFSCRGQFTFHTDHPQLGLVLCLCWFERMWPLASDSQGRGFVTFNFETLPHLLLKSRNIRFNSLA